jgi:uncharacterized membrane protein YdbT with pleckstrin-like domain
MDLHPGEEIVYEGRPSWRSILSYYVIADLGAVALAVVGFLIWGIGVALLILAVAMLIALVTGLFMRIGKHYVITNERLWIKVGILSRSVQQTRIDRVQNVNTRQSFVERLLQVGTVDFDTAGTDDSEFAFHGIEDPEEVVAAVDRVQRGAAHARPAAGV